MASDSVKWSNYSDISGTHGVNTTPFCVGTWALAPGHQVWTAPLRFLIVLGKCDTRRKHIFQTSFTARRVKRGADEDDKWPATTEDGQTIIRIPYVESGTTSTDFFPAQSWIIVSLRDRTAERWGRQNACVWQTWQAKFLLFSGDLHLS